VKAYYEDNKSDFTQEEGVKASHILVRPEGDDKAGAKKKAERLLSKIKKGADFAKLAKKHSEDKGSARNGGNLGYFARGRMAKSFEEAAFALKTGEVSELVETKFGYHIIKVVARRAGGALPLEVVKGDIEEVMKKNQALFIARDRMEALEGVFASTDDIDELTKLVSKDKVKVGVTPFFAEDDAEGEFASDVALKNAAFGLNPGGVSAPVESGGAVYLIKVLDRVEEHVAPYADVADKVEAALRKDKAFRKANEAATDMLAKVGEGAKFATVASALGLKVKETSFASKLRPKFKDIGLDLSRRPGVFELTAEKPVFTDYFAHANAFYILSFRDEKKADRKDFDIVKVAFKERFLQYKRQKAFDDWLADLRKNADVEIFAERL
jgi:peptidyl-prolyl cis-trans isomerase D